MVNQYTGSDADWTKAYVPVPRYFQKPDGTPFGVMTLNEGYETIMPKLPQNLYQHEGRRIDEWRVLLYSRTRGDVIGDADFFEAMRKLVLNGYIKDDNGERVLISALTLTELDALMR
ncbi:MAG: hypothetical protein MJ071_00070 [Oscillospiraceae bacterium]|nr:hypothetical protein [Oscillospiraceae bacterium]